VTKPPTRKQRAKDMDSLLAEIATKSLQDEQGKPVPSVEVRLLLTKPQAKALSKFLERGELYGSAKKPPSDEVMGAIWSVQWQLSRGLKAGKGRA
jgi:hypothetical protein